jgi:hypothetical protein
MRRTTYKIRSPLFPPDLPSRMFYAQTSRNIEGWYTGSVTCLHFNPQGRPVKIVTVVKAGTWASRKKALRRAQWELSKILANYLSENIYVSVQNT